MSIKIEEYGKLVSGKIIYSICLINKTGVSVEILNFGGIIRSILMPDYQGIYQDIVLGFDSLEDYMVNQPNFGAVIGRLAGPVPGCKLEYANRTVMLPPSNDLGRHVHGGRKGFARSVWDFTTSETEQESQVTLVYDSPDGDDGYPGNIRAIVNYTLTGKGELMVHYSAESNEPTPFNPTNHTYFNLAGHQSGPVDNQILSIQNKKVIVDGCSLPVEGTGLDFRQPKKIGEILLSEDEGLHAGINHFHVLDGSGLRNVMRMEDVESGRVLEIDTDCTGAIVYDGGNLCAVKGKHGAVYEKRSGFVFEPIYVKDTTPFNPSQVRLISPASPFSATTVYRFLHC